MDMPASYTHYLVAKNAYLASSPPIQNAIRVSLPLYFFGAQGADFCFFNPSLSLKRKNLGSYLHREGGLPTFFILKALAARDCEILAYALGYVTHYAADSAFHPYVYAMTDNSPLRHSRLENILDIRFKKRFSNAEQDAFFYGKLSEKEKDLLFLIYTAIALKNGFHAPQKPAFLRSISLFNAYMPLPNALFDGSSAEVRAIAANEEKRAWRYPAAPHIIKTDSADELLSNSIASATELIDAFFHATRTNEPLNKEKFGKGFLTGI
jgi:hypothetical protein